jgi:hypothetical protein
VRNRPPRGIPSAQDSFDAHVRCCLCSVYIEADDWSRFHLQSMAI